MKLRPSTAFGYLLTAAIIGAALYGLIVSSALGSAVRQQVEPFVTLTPQKPKKTNASPPTETEVVATKEFTPVPSDTPQPTNTLAPSRTPTLTITPKPAAVWAKVSSSDSGALVRKAPGFDGEYLASVDNESLVQVLPEEEKVDGVYWTHVLLEDGRDGWMVRNLLVTATPAPGG